jgi:tRNA (guanosine-2'-O-)-methyltransferase
VEQQDQLAFLTPLVTAERRAKIEEVLSQRTDRFRVVLEDVFRSHNASAVMRSCECFGIQYLHTIENQHRYHLNPDVARGASNWMTLIRHRTPATDNTTACIDALRSEGYKIAVTSLADDAYAIQDLPVDQKLAICFGTEWAGVSPQLARQADYRVRIPMFGFTQSFNVSVSVALCLYELVNRMRRETSDWELDEETRQALRLDWYKHSIRFADRILQAASHRVVQ